MRSNLGRKGLLVLRNLLGVSIPGATLGEFGLGELFLLSSISAYNKTIGDSLKKTHKNLIELIYLRHNNNSECVLHQA